MNDEFSYPYNQAWCYERTGSPKASTQTFLCTATVILCAILLELLVHVSCEPRTAQKERVEDEEAATLLPAKNESSRPSTPIMEQPQSQGELQYPVEDQDQNGTATTTETDKPFKVSWCVKSPGRQIRAIRLIFAVVIYTFALIAFIIRIREATSFPSLARACSSYVHNTSPPSWTAMTFFIIIPFICASGAFMRAFTDCVLLRLDMSLPNGFGDSDQCGWTICMPIFVVMIFLYMIVECLKAPIACIIGDREFSMLTAKSDKGKQKAEEVELQEGEARVPVDGGDEVRGADEQDQSSDLLPAYDDVVGSKAETTETRKGDDIV